MPIEKLIEITTFSNKIAVLLNLPILEKKVFRSKGLLVHLLKRKHYKAAKYLDFLADIIHSPDYTGKNKDSIELVKCFKDNIFVSIKLDISNDVYYVSTMFDISSSKLETYYKSKRLSKVD